jgi:hypothetical protein
MTEAYVKLFKLKEVYTQTDDLSFNLTERKTVRMQWRSVGQNIGKAKFRLMFSIKNFIYFTLNCLFGNNAYKRIINYNIILI